MVGLVVNEVTAYLNNEDQTKGADKDSKNGVINRNVCVAFLRYDGLADALRRKVSHAVDKIELVVDHGNSFYSSFGSKNIN